MPFPWAGSVLAEQFDVSTKIVCLRIEIHVVGRFRQKPFEEPDFRNSADPDRAMESEVEERNRNEVFVMSGKHASSGKPGKDHPHRPHRLCCITAGSEQQSKGFLSIQERP